jgi:hypothetical protein
MLPAPHSARFEGPALQQGMKAASVFLAGRIPFDMYFLGWNSDLFTGGHLAPVNKTTVSPKTGGFTRSQLPFPLALSSSSLIPSPVP